MTRLILVCAAALAVWSAAVAVYVVTRPATHPIYRYCDGRLEQVPAVTPCPDGELRMIA